MALQGYISTDARAPTLRNTTAPVPTEYGRVMVADARVTISTGTINTLYNLFVLPKNAIVLGMMVKAPDLDSNGSPTITLSLGDSGDDDRYLSASTIGQAGGFTTTLASTGAGYKNTADTLVQLKLSAAAAMLAAGEVYAALTYVVDNATTT